MTWEVSGVDYLVMECVEGETLANRLVKGALPLEQALNLGAQIADALDISASQRRGASGPQASEHHDDGERGKAARFWSR
jgi:hypothetical protein